MTTQDDLDGFEKYEDSAWLSAIRAADRWRDATARGKTESDTGPLVTLLSAKLLNAGGQPVTLTAVECELLIDLLRRHQLQQRAGGRTTPAYKRTVADLRLEIADEFVEALVKNGSKEEDAIKRATDKSYVAAETLRLYRQGRVHAERFK
jgi:hypothetical protein